MLNKLFRGRAALEFFLSTCCSKEGEVPLCKNELCKGLSERNLRTYEWLLCPCRLCDSISCSKQGPSRKPSSNSAFVKQVSSQASIKRMRMQLRYASFSGLYGCVLAAWCLTQLLCEVSIPHNFCHEGKISVLKVSFSVSRWCKGFCSMPPYSE